jgi:hypothetical protein
MRASITDGFTYIFDRSLEGRLRILNKGILTAPPNWDEVTVENFEKLHPSWLLPGLTHLRLTINDRCGETISRTLDRRLF